MTLAEKLYTLDADTVVSIGSASAWFDIGYAGDIRRPEYLADLTEREYAKMCAIATKARRELMKLLTTARAWTPDDSKPFDTTVREYADRLQKVAERIGDMLTKVHVSEAKVDRFTALGGREVLVEYPGKTDGVALRIRVAGDETGDYWLISEKYPDGMPVYKVK